MPKAAKPATSISTMVPGSGMQTAASPKLSPPADNRSTASSWTVLSRSDSSQIVIRERVCRREPMGSAQFTGIDPHLRPLRCRNHTWSPLGTLYPNAKSSGKRFSGGSRRGIASDSQAVAVARNCGSRDPDAGAEEIPGILEVREVNVARISRLRRNYQIKSRINHVARSDRSRRRNWYACPR